MEAQEEQLEIMFRKMWEIRLFEEQVHQIYLDGKLHGTTHLYNGQEAVAVGVCSALTQKDLITSTHRGHGHAIAKGSNINRMMAEIMGKETGTCKGKGGSMHIGDFSTGNLGANGVVGGSFGIAVGAALGFQMRKEPHIVACFFGDGATNEGSFHEALNLASIWKSPVIFVCENNLYGFSTPVSKSMNINDISIRAQSYGMQSATVDGNDCLAVYKATLRAKEAVLRQGPLLLVCNTYRYMGHSKSDTGLSYRSEEEISSWRKKDPLLQMEHYLIQVGWQTDKIEKLKQQAKQTITEAVEFAEKSPEPSLLALTQDVYAVAEEA